MGEILQRRMASLIASSRSLTTFPEIEVRLLRPSMPQLPQTNRKPTDNQFQLENLPLKVSVPPGVLSLVLTSQTTTTTTDRPSNSMKPRASNIPKSRVENPPQDRHRPRSLTTTFYHHHKPLLDPGSGSSVNRRSTSYQQLSLSILSMATSCLTTLSRLATILKHPTSFHLLPLPGSTWTDQSIHMATMLYTGPVLWEM